MFPWRASDRFGTGKSFFRRMPLPAGFPWPLRLFGSTFAAKFLCRVDSFCPVEAPRDLPVPPRASSVPPRTLKIIGFP